jgi:hypothetical protein
MKPVVSEEFTLLIHFLDTQMYVAPRLAPSDTVTAQLSRVAKTVACMLDRDSHCSSLSKRCQMSMTSHVIPQMTSLECVRQVSVLSKAHFCGTLLRLDTVRCPCLVTRGYSLPPHSRVCLQFLIFCRVYYQHYETMTGQTITQRVLR